MTQADLKVALIGPDTRYKGGIAQFTDELYSVLRSKADAMFITWYQQYPGFLTTRDFFVGDPAKPPAGCAMLGYLNPLSWFALVQKLRQKKVNVALFTWSHPVHAPIYLVLFGLIKLFSPSRIAIVCHNVLPHERFTGDALLTRLCFWFADCTFVHSRDEKVLLERIIGESRRINALFLPIHDFFGGDDSRGTQEPATLKKHLLYFGIIRPYKGVDVLIDAFTVAKEHIPELRLTIAGEPFEQGLGDALREKIARSGLSESIQFHDRYIPDDEVSSYYRNCDVAIFPYTSVTQSGSLTVAYSFDRPVIASDLPAFREAVLPGLSGLLVKPGDPQKLANAIVQFYEEPSRFTGVQQMRDALSWPRYVELLLESQCLYGA